jgi:hypothetical protein
VTNIKANIVSLTNSVAVYFAELFPTHLRAKGMTIGMAAISLMNVMWLQVAPTAFA